MLDFLRALLTHAAYGQRMLGIIPALVIAELSYKFHSFVFECMGLLATWLVLDLLTELVVGKPAMLAKEKR